MSKLRPSRIGPLPTFCSKRCADQDLGNWLTEEYKLASDEEADLDEEYPEEI